MITALPLLLLAGAIILFAAEIFTNGVEWVGVRLGLGHGALGSVLAAFGTALPETLIPIIAIVFVGSADASDVGVGSILGATVFKMTASFTVAAVGVSVFQGQRQHGLDLHFDTRAISRDFSFFFLVFACGILSSFLPHAQAVKIVIGVGLVTVYVVYAVRAVMDSGESGDEEELAPLRLHRVMGGVGPPPTWLAWLQLIVSLALIVGAADLFVKELDTTAKALHLAALALSLIVSPFATELPEMFNSIIWVRDGKDTLALGNLSGSAVYQASVPMALGVVFTNWDLTTTALVAASIALASGGFVYLCVRQRGYLKASWLRLPGLFWLSFVIFIIGRTILS